MVKEFRRRRFPLDAIVQDWQYWPEGGTGWGSHEFDKTRFPDPKGTFDAIHALGATRDDLGLGQVLHGQPELRRAEGRGLPLPAQPRALVEGLARQRVHVLRRVLSRRPRDVLAADERADLLERRRRVVARRDGARLRRRPAAGGPRAAHEPDGPRPRRAPDERVPAHDGARRGGRPARRRSGQARHDPHPLGVGRLAALRRDGVVGRHHRALGRPPGADPRRPLVQPLRHAVVGDGHRCLQHRRPGRQRERGLSRALHALVPVRRVLAGVPLARLEHAARALALRRPRPPGVEEPRAVREPALPSPALQLHARLPGHARARHDPPRARDGLPRGREGPRRAGPVPLRPRVPREPGDGAGRHAPQRLPSRRRLVRLLDGRAPRRGPDDRRRGPVREDAAARARRLHRPVRPRAAVDGREAGRPRPPRRLHGPRRCVHAPRGRRRDERAREGRLLDDPAPLGRGEGAR